MFHPQGPTFWELAVQALSSTERGYDLLAPKFDFTPFRTPEWLTARIAAYWESNNIGPFRAGLDVCCGTGAGAKLLRPFCAQRVVGWDMSRGMLDIARRESGNWAGDAEMEWVRGDVLQPQFTGEFDVAVCLGALGHILPADATRFYENIHRALEPGGRLYLVTAARPSRWSHRYWVARGFNGAMHVRNWLIRPPFIMFYLTHLLPELESLLPPLGFEVRVQRGIFPAPAAEYALVEAIKQDST